MALTTAERSRIMKEAWKRRKPKAIDAVTGRPIYAGGVIYQGKPMLKTTAAALAAGIPPHLINPFRSVKTGKGTSKELVVYPYGIEEGVLVNARTGEVTNRWADGTVGVPRDVAELAADESEAYDPITGEEYEWIRGNPFRPHLIPFRGRRLPRRGAEIPGIRELNPEGYVYGPTRFRPPATWWAKTIAGLRAGYRKRAGQTEESYRAALSRIAGGIWSRFSQKTREEILGRYEPMAARAKKIGNPGEAWHTEQRIKYGRLARVEPEARFGHFLLGKESAHHASEIISRRLGLRNPVIGHCPVHGGNIAVNPRAKRVRCPAGHWLNVPGR